MSIKQTLERIEDALAVPILVYYATIVAIVVMASYLGGCDTEDGYESEQASYKPIETPEPEAAATPTPEPAFKEWSLNEIQSERYNCWDDFYEFVGDNYQMFCLCLVEKISLRWEREDYIRHQYQYWQHLSSTEAMQRCTKLPDFWTDPTGSVEEDRKYDPEATPKPGSTATPEPTSGLGDLLKPNK